MANERRLNKSAARTPRHGSSTTTTTNTAAATAGSNNSTSSSSSSSSTVNAVSGGKKQSRQYRLPHPPVPHAQTSLLQSQRVPASVAAYPSARQAGYESPQLSDSRYYASGGRGGGPTTTTATTTTSTTAGPAPGGLAVTAATSGAAAPDAADGSTEATVPSADPDVMEAKKGLNKWGAFDSLSGSGTGTFGFGPLLFHHMDETPRDPYDTTNMMLNDPISFNPMSAISWARLDESPDSADDLEGDHSSSIQQPDIALAAAAGSSGSRKDGSGSRAGYVDSPASTAASPRHGSGASYASDVSESRTSSVAGSSVGNISRTFSDTSLVSPDTERSTAGAPPAFTSPSNSRTPNPIPGHQQQQLGRQTEASVQYGTLQPQQPAYPTQQPHSSRSSSSQGATASQQPYSGQSYAHTRPQQQAQHLSRHRNHQQSSTQSRPQQQQQLQQLQQQRIPAPNTSLPAHQAPATTDLLLCLGPHCSARFPTEQELAAHYRAEHAFTCTWASCSATSFTSSNALTWHYNAEHLLMCPVPGCCGATFGSKRALDGHLKVSRLGPEANHQQFPFCVLTCLSWVGQVPLKILTLESRERS